MARWLRGRIKEVKIRKQGKEFGVEVHQLSNNQRHRGIWANVRAIGVQALIRSWSSGGQGGTQINVMFYTEFDPNNPNTSKMFLKPV